MELPHFTARSRTFPPAVPSSTRLDSDKYCCIRSPLGTARLLNSFRVLSLASLALFPVQVRSFVSYSFNRSLCNAWGREHETMQNLGGAAGGGAAKDNRFLIPAVDGVIEGRDMLQGNMGVDFVGYSLQRQRPRATVIYFGGDCVLDSGCTDLAEAGTEDGDAILKFQNWVNIVRLLSNKFKSWQRQEDETCGEESSGVDVLAVEPTRVEDGVWSCFDTFVPSTRSGEPARGYLREGRGAKHLDSLLQLAIRKALGTTPRGDAGLAPPPLILVGFSKGGVVLNQLLTELSVAGDGTVGGGKGLGGREGGYRVAEVHYVDVGLNCRGAYLTDPQTIQGLATQGAGEGKLKIRLHGTPRQWEDKRRTWVGEEKERMLALCARHGVAATQRLYFQGAPPSLAMHFNCIEAFSLDRPPSPT